MSAELIILLAVPCFHNIAEDNIQNPVERERVSSSDIITSVLSVIPLLSLKSTEDEALGAALTTALTMLKFERFYKATPVDLPSS